MENYTYNIIFPEESNGRQTEGENNISNPQEEGGINAQKPTESKKENVSKNIALAAATDILRKSISYTTGNIEKWTGIAKI